MNFILKNYKSKFSENVTAVTFVALKLDEIYLDQCERDELHNCNSHSKVHN